MNDDATVASNSDSHDEPTLPPAPKDVNPTTPHLAASPGSLGRFGDYELVRELARGGMGIVYEAVQTGLGRRVALKMILSGEMANDADVARFHAEAESAAGLDHPGIVPLFEVGVHEGRHFFSMGFVPGGSLQDKLKRGPLPPREAAATLRMAAEAVHHAHGKGVVHRDLKPHNVLLDADGSPRVADFGLAKKVDGDSGLTRTGQVMGTPSYMPPEQAKGDRDVGPAADVYSIGATLYACLVGRPPFQAATPMDTLLAVLEQDPVAPRLLNRAVPKDLETIALKALQKDPARRYASAQDLADDLGRWLAGEPIKARPVGRVEKMGLWAKRNPAAFWSFATILFLIFVIIGAQAKSLAIQSRLTLEALEARNATEKALADESQLRVAAGKLAENNRRQVARLASANAARALGRGDPAGAVPWLVEAARISPEPEASKLRGRALAHALHATRPAFRIWHPAAPSQIAFSNDGARLVVGGVDGTARVYLASSGKLVGPALTLGAPIYAVCFAPDGKTVYAAGGVLGSSGAIGRWDGEGKPIGTPWRSANTVFFVECRPDGGVIAVEIPIDGKGIARLYEPKTGKELGKAPCSPQSPTVTAIRPLVSTVSARVLNVAGRTASVHDLATGKTIGTATAAGWIANPRLLADGDRFLLNMSREVRFYDSKTGAPTSPPIAEAQVVFGAAMPERDLAALALADGSLRTLRVGSGRESTVDHTPIAAGDWRAWFSPDGRLVAASENNGDVRVYDAASRQPLSTVLHHGDAIVDVAWSDANRIVAVASADGAVAGWDLANVPGARVYASTHFPLSALKLRDDGKAWLYGSDLAIVVDPATGGWGTTFPSWRQASAIAVAPDGGKFACGHWGGEAQTWDAATGKPLGPAIKHARGLVAAMALAPDGRRLATLGADTLDGPEQFFRDLRFWDIATGKPIGGKITGLASKFEILGGGYVATCVAFTPDGKEVLTAGGHLDLGLTGGGGLRGSARRFDAATGKPLGKEMPMARNMVGFAAVPSPDGRRLAVLAGSLGRSSGELRVFERESGALIAAPIPLALGARIPAFSPDGVRLLVPCDRTIEVFDVATCSPALPPLRHAAAVTVAKFATGGSSIVSAAGMEAHLWSAETGDPLAPPANAEFQIEDVDVSDNGARLAAMGRYGVRVFDLVADGSRNQSDVEAYARLLAGATVDGSLLRPTTAAQRDADWADLSKRFSQDFTSKDGQRFAWRNAEAKRAETAEQTTTAVHLLDGLIAMEPSDINLRSRRGEMHARRGSWLHAAIDFKSALEKNSDDNMLWFKLGACALADRNAMPKAHQQVVDEMLKRHTGPTMPWTLWERTLKMACLHPDDVPSESVVRPLMDRVDKVPAVQGGLAWRHLCLGLAELRLKRWDNAAQRFDQCLAEADIWPLCRACAEAGAALSATRLNRPADAARHRAAALATLAAEEAKGVYDWQDAVIARTILAEK